MRRCDIENLDIQGRVMSTQFDCFDKCRINGLGVLLEVGKSYIAENLIHDGESCSRAANRTKRWY